MLYIIKELSRFSLCPEKTENLFRSLGRNSSELFYRKNDLSKNTNRKQNNNINALLFSIRTHLANLRATIIV